MAVERGGGCWGGSDGRGKRRRRREKGVTGGDWDMAEQVDFQAIGC